MITKIEDNAIFDPERLMLLASRFHFSSLFSLLPIERLVRRLIAPQIFSIGSPYNARLSAGVWITGPDCPRYVWESKKGVDQMRQNLTLRIVVSVSALLIAAAHVWRPEAKIDSITIVLLVICALPWLQPLIKSVELLGVKLELQELQDKVAEARGAAESASRQAGLALSASTAPMPAPARAATGSADSDIQALASEYENIRETQRSGDARTAAMTDVVRRMIDVARRTESLDISGALANEGRGMFFRSPTF